MKYSLKHYVLKESRYTVKDGGGGWIEDVWEADIQVEINIDEIVRNIANIAIRNRSGRSRNLNGLIKAKVLKRYRQEVAQ